MKYSKTINLLLLTILSSVAIANENIIGANNNEDMYQIKFIMISHSLSNYIDYDKKYKGEKFHNLNNITLRVFFLRTFRKKAK